MKLRRFLLALLALGYGLLLTLAFCLVRFPWDDALARLAREVHAAHGPSLQFAPASFGLGGLVVGGLAVEWPMEPRPLRLEAGELRLAPTLCCARLEASVGGGQLTGQAGLSSAALTIQGVDLAQIGGLRDWTGGSVRGLLEGQARAEWKGGSPEQWSGEASLRLEGVDLDHVSLAGLALERLPLGQAELAAVLDTGSGVVRLSRVEVGGGDLELTATGTITLSADLLRSRLELQGQFRLAGQTQANAGELLPSILGIQPDAQGWLHAQLSGSLAQPRLTAN